MLPPNGRYLEPFCGACTVMHLIRCESRYGGDTNPHIIRLMRAVRDGWDPPENVTEDEFKFWREEGRKGSKDPMVAFCSHGCAFGGFAHSGYARDKAGKVNYAAQARRSLLKQRRGLQGVKLKHWSYDEWRPQQFDVIYADPPYEGTAPVGVPGGKKFDSKKFWDWADAASSLTSLLVSSYACPVKKSRVVWERTTTMGMRFKDGRTKTEKVFQLGGRGVGLFA